METGTIIVIIAAVLIVLFALYWMRGRGGQMPGGGPADISGDQGTDIRSPGSSPLGGAGSEPSGRWSSIDETERGLDERDDEEIKQDEAPRL